MLVIGHLGKDADVNNVNGKSVINFNVAHSENYTDRNGAKTTKTTWVQCAYWTDKTAIAPYLKKGTQVYVEGAPEVKLWTDNAGKANANQTLRVATIQLLGSKKEGDNNTGSVQAPSTPSEPAGFVPVDDLPF